MGAGVARSQRASEQKPSRACSAARVTSLASDSLDDPDRWSPGCPVWAGVFGRSSVVTVRCGREGIQGGVHRPPPNLLYLRALWSESALRPAVCEPSPVDRLYYVRLGMEAITQMVDQEHAVVWSEVEAKAADRAWPGVGRRVDPHNLSAARLALRTQGMIAESHAVSRGGRSISVLHMADLHRRRRAFEDAAKRKRLLQARYLGWAVGTTGRPGLFGPGGEQVLYRSLVEAARHGYRLVRPEGGHVGELFDEPVPIGPLDNVAFLQLVDKQGFPTGSLVILFEVKNIRDWIYPRAPELHQLLDKAARLQLQHPDLPFVPALVCRRAHTTAMYMAQDLGFQVMQTYTQFILPRHDLDSAHIEEVRQELGYLDLLVHDIDHSSLTKPLSGSMLQVASVRSQRWAQTAPALGQLFHALRGSPSPPVRSEHLNNLRAAAKAAGLYEHGSW